MITISYGFDQENPFFERWSWFKLNNLGLALAMTFKFYTSVAIGLKLTVRKFWRLIPSFVEVTGGKLVGGLFPPILNWTGLTTLVHSIDRIAQTLYCEVSISNVVNKRFHYNPSLIIIYIMRNSC